MMVPLSAVQFSVILRIAGRSLNKVVDPDARDKGVELYGTELGVLLKLRYTENNSMKTVQALVPWHNVQQADGDFDGCFTSKSTAVPVTKQQMR